MGVFSLLLSSNDVSVDIGDDKGSFEFSPKAEFTSTLHQTLKQNHHTSHNCYILKNMLKLLAFKWLWNHLLFEYFPHKCVHFFFSFVHCYNNIVKPKWSVKPHFYTSLWFYNVTSGTLTFQKNLCYLLD